MTEDRFPPAGKEGGHPAALAAEPRMPDGVHATVDAVETTGRHPSGNPAVREPGLAQLRMRSDAVLPRRHPDDAAVGRVEFFPHTGEKSTRPRFLPPTLV